MLGKGHRLYKREKLCSVTAIERLFTARPPRGATLTDSWGKVSVSLVYPIRMVAGDNPGRGGAPVRFLVSVPKKRLRHAVDRVAMRRRIREAYRLERAAIEDIAETDVPKKDVAFIYVANELVDFERVRKAMRRLLAALDASAGDGDDNNNQSDRP